MSDKEPDIGDAENSSVAESQLTHGDHAQPVSDDSATGKAMSYLQKLAAQGENYITKPLSRDKAKEIAKAISPDPEKPWGHGVVYNARSKLLKKKIEIVTDTKSSGINADVTVDDLLEGANPIGDKDKPAGDTPPSDAPTPLELNGDGKEKKEEFEQMPIEAIQTISDVIVDAVAEHVGKTKPIPAKRIEAIKTTYSTTLKAYNASMPKWLLIPICIALTLVVFVLPFKDDIAKAIDKALYGEGTQLEKGE